MILECSVIDMVPLQPLELGSSFQQAKQLISRQIKQ